MIIMIIKAFYIVGERSILDEWCQKSQWLSLVVRVIRLSHSCLYSLLAWENFHRFIPRSICL